MAELKKSDFDFSIRPQDDFYRFVNGGWIKKNKIPATEMRWGSFDVLIHKTRRQLHALLRGLSEDKKVKRGSDYAKLRDFFISAMDMKRRNKASLAPLKEGFDRIDAIRSSKDFACVFAWMHSHGADMPWYVWFDQDDKNSKRMVLRLGQSGLGVPDRNYFVKKDKESKRIREAYKKHVARILNIEKHYSKRKISVVTETILKIETALAKASSTPVERRDVHAQYNKHTLAQLTNRYPAFSWKKYFDLLCVPSNARQHIIIDQPKFLREVNRLLTKISTEEWKQYLRWHYLDCFSGALGENYIDANFEYRRALFGLKELPELWKRSVQVCNQLMGDALGKLYVETYFSKTAKKEIEKLVRNLIKTYRLRIKGLDWMSATTKRKALRKLDTMSLQLGYPKKWQSYGRLKIEPHVFGENVLNANKFAFDEDVKKLSKPTNRDEWYTTASTVNAYYSPNLNQITFPAGILQPPFFYSEGDEAVNYGGIGAVIGHELTHGFDDSGSKFDEYGNLKDWWTKADKSHFEKRTHTLVKQFNTFRVADGVPVNGKLTLGENIADLGGLIIAYEAFKNSYKGSMKEKSTGFTPEQRVFVSHAITERTLVRDEFVKFTALNDEHAPNEFRSNAPVSNIDNFYKLFDVKKGDELYRSEKKRARIW